MYQKKAFTLIELLVVIAIVALLLGILIPMLGKAKAYAEEVLCKSNLHQYSLATEIYCNEADDRIPPSWSSLYSKLEYNEESGGKRACRWHRPEYNLQAYGETEPDNDGVPMAGPYWSYLAATKANVCPTFANLAPKYGSAHLENTDWGSSQTCVQGAFVPQFSYSMNTIFGAGGQKSQCKSPSKTFLWAEENMWTLNGLSDEVLNDNALLVVANKADIVDGFASYHKISKGKLIIQRDTHEYESGMGVSNVLMVDGSTTWATPEESWLYRGKDL